eukprot:4240244-Prymnesium_polylepis.1
MGDARSKAHGRCAIEGRGAIPVVHVDTPHESALARWASSSHAGRRERFSWPCWRACRALLFPLYTIAYVQ